MTIYTCLTLLLCCGLTIAQVPPTTPPLSPTPPFQWPFPTGTTLTLPQSIFLINSGGPAIPADTSDPNSPVPPYIADTFFTGGAVWSDPTMGPGRWATLRYAHSFTYDIPLPNGIYTVQFDMLETTYTTPNMRVFTITANGVQSDSIDLAVISGGVINKQTSIFLMPIVSNGHLHIVFQSTKNNATVSAIEVSPSLIYSGLEAHFIRFYPCDMSYPQTTCIQINPGSQPQYAPPTVPVPPPTQPKPPVQ